MLSVEREAVYQVDRPKQVSAFRQDVLSLAVAKMKKYKGSDKMYRAMFAKLVSAIVMDATDERNEAAGDGACAIGGEGAFYAWIRK